MNSFGRKQKLRQRPALSNPLYINTNTATAEVASRLKITKHDLVNTSIENVAVRAAAAEALLTSETQVVLSKDGINVECLRPERLNINTPRSSDTLLVKNLPQLTATIMDELKTLFEQHGSLEKICSPSRVGPVIISYLHATDAGAAFRRLSFHVFHEKPLFLQWAPLGLLTTQTIEKEVQGDEIDVDDTEFMSGSTVHVKNLPHSCTNTQLRETFSKHFTKVKRNPECIRSIKVLAQKGYGFVEFVDANVRNLCLRAFENACATLDGRILTLEKAHTHAGAQEETLHRTENHSTTFNDVEDILRCPPGYDPLKLTLKNVPFEATPSEIKSLFSAFTEIRTVRIPKRLYRYDTTRKSNHRGFAFVEFTTEDGAREALRMLSQTHLYGRHLILEYAKMGD